jgi:O-glycosyl hydrolase
MDGFGASLTDSSAQLFATLKIKNPSVYNSVLDVIFNRRNGINILRVPIGTTDFSPSSLQYTMADKKGQQNGVNDTIGPLSNFNMNGANQYIIPFLKDALIRNGDLKINLLPWSPPAWMKSSNSVNGGTLKPETSNILTEYLVKSVQGFHNALGIIPWSLSVQNEPTNPTAYPSMTLDNSDESSILSILRGRLAQVGLANVQLWGHEDNYADFSDAAALVNLNQSSVDGIAWHCYKGFSSLLSNYTSAITVANATKSMHMTECSGLSDSSHSSSSTSLQWWMNNIFSQPSQGISSITSWNLALDQNYGPRLSRAYCKNCVGSIEISTTGKVTSNVQQLLLAHHATVASDLTRFGGQKASRIATSVSGDSNNCIRSTLAFSARWNSSGSDNSQRVGLVVQNVCARSVTTTISVNNQQHFDISIGNGVTSVVLTV